MQLFREAKKKKEKEEKERREREAEEDDLRIAQLLRDCYGVE